MAYGLTLRYSTAGFATASPISYSGRSHGGLLVRSRLVGHERPLVKKVALTILRAMRARATREAKKRKFDMEVNEQTLYIAI